jgi:hypothetical protein
MLLEPVFRELRFRGAVEGAPGSCLCFVDGMQRTEDNRLVPLAAKTGCPRSPGDEGFGSLHHLKKQQNICHVSSSTNLGFTDYRDLHTSFP